MPIDRHSNFIAQLVSLLFLEVVLYIYYHKRNFDLKSEISCSFLPRSIKLYDYYVHH